MLVSSIVLYSCKKKEHEHRVYGKIVDSVNTGVKTTTYTLGVDNKGGFLKPDYSTLYSFTTDDTGGFNLNFYATIGAVIYIDAPNITRHLWGAGTEGNDIFAGTIVDSTK